MTDFAKLLEGLEPLTVVYALSGVVNVAYLLLSRFRSRPRLESYILSDSKGHTVKITWDAAAPADERARVMNEKIRSLEAKAAT